MDKNKLYRNIPKVDLLLAKEEIQEAVKNYGHKIVMEAIRKELAALRNAIAICNDAEELKQKSDSLVENICLRVRKMHRFHVQKVINATGTILHTNLGRAPMDVGHAKHLVDVVSGYSNLEYNLKEGMRGERYAHFEELLCKITGAEAAMAVNNNAAAVMLILNAMAKGGEVIVSRGELVEIGGKFRIPDVMEVSGAKLVEVGTTNKTHLFDYEEAITPDTKALLKVHTSNYRIVGFTESVSSAQLCPMAKEREIPVIEDLGSGSLIDLSRFGLNYEPTVQEVVASGVDVVTFSGDKLLGGPQAGIIVGKKKYIDRMKKNQLTRALRIDKFTVTALEEVLIEYLDVENAIQKIPVLSMISATPEEMKEKAEILANRLENLPIDVCVLECESQIGGGSFPMERLKSFAVCIRADHMSVVDLELALRRGEVPVIVRTAEDMLWLDVRTIFSDEFDLVVRMLREALEGE